MLVSDLQKRARALANVVRDPNFDERGLVARRALESEWDRQVRVALMLADGAALREGRRTPHRGELCPQWPCGHCFNPTDAGLERVQEDSERPGRGPRACELCGLFPITQKERRRLLAAYEERSRQGESERANVVQTPTPQFQHSEWVCQHHKTWFTSAAAGRPVRSPASTIATGDGWQAFSCGFGRECAKEHQRRRDGDVVDDEPLAYTQIFSGLTAGPEGGVINMPFSSEYPQGAPSQRQP